MPARRLFLGMSHTPLLGLNPVDEAVQTPLMQAIDQARSIVTDFDPELVLLIGPDHYNGFFNELMPPFCIGSEASAVGDFLTPAGQLNVDGEVALSMASHLMDHGFDMAVSRRMRVDHGFAQALQFLWGENLTVSPPVVPLFVNSVAQPTIPRLSRCRDLGLQIGNFLDDLNRRALVIGSGGLSHEPPVPTMAHPDAAVRERITVRREATAEDRAMKITVVKAAGMSLASGNPSMKPLNPQWDQQWMDGIETGDFKSLLASSEEELAAQAGLSANESKTWLVARAALGADSPTRRLLRHYQAIPEFIAGYGILALEGV